MAASPRPRPRPRPAASRVVAIVSSLAFGCTVVRVPVSELGAPDPEIRGAVATPQVELWIEGDGDVPPAESAGALAGARAALDRALASRAGDAPNADAVLYVRERAVARTPARRHGQVAAIVGIAVGAVALVAVVVLAILAGRDSRGSGVAKAAASPPRAAPRPSTAAPAGAVAGARGVPAPATIPAPGTPHSVPAPGGARPRGGGVGVNVGVAVDVPLPVGPVPAFADVPPDASDEEMDDAWADAEAAAVPDLPPAAALDVERRGYFAGDEVVLDLVLVDRKSGRVLWTRSVRDDVDPRDAPAVARLVERALASGPALARFAPGR